MLQPAREYAGATLCPTGQINTQRQYVRLEIPAHVLLPVVHLGQTQGELLPTAHGSSLVQLSSQPKDLDTLTLPTLAAATAVEYCHQQIRAEAP
jgi:hypothetical protein